MSPCHVLGRGPGEQRLWVPMHPALGPGASVVLPLAPRGCAPAAFDLEPESLRVPRPLALHATPFTLSLASLQLPALPTAFLSSVLRASAWLPRAPPRPSGQVPLPSARGGRPASGPPAGPRPLPDGVRSCPQRVWPRQRGQRGVGLGRRWLGRWAGLLLAPEVPVGLGLALFSLLSPGALSPMATPSPVATPSPAATPLLVSHCPLLLPESFASGRGDSQAATRRGSWEWSPQAPLWSWDLAAGRQGLGGPDRMALRCLCQGQSPSQSLYVSPFTMVIVTCLLTPGSQPEPVQPDFQLVWNWGHREGGRALQPQPRHCVRVRVAEPPTGHVTPVHRARGQELCPPERWHLLLSP